MCEYLLVMKTPPEGEGVYNVTAAMKHSLKYQKAKKRFYFRAKCSVTAHTVSEHQQFNCSGDKSTHPSLHDKTSAVMAKEPLRNLLLIFSLRNETEHSSSCAPTKSLPVLTSLSFRFEWCLTGKVRW